MKFLGFCLTLAFFCWSQFHSAWGATLSLFQKDGTPASDYNYQLPQVQADDVLEFSEGEKFRVYEIIGHGNTTLILSGKFQGSDKIVALRVPLYQGYFRVNYSHEVDFDRRRKLLNRGNEKIPEHVKFQDSELARPGNLTYQDIFNSSIWSQEEYDKLKIPTPKLFKSRKNEFIALERIPNFPEFNRPLSLEDVFSKKYNLSQYPDMQKALFEFAEALAPLQSIPDFRAEQVLYHPTQKKWLLADRMGSPSKPILYTKWALSDHPLVLEASTHSKELAEKIKQRIEVARKNLAPRTQLIVSYPLRSFSPLQDLNS